MKKTLTIAFAILVLVAVFFWVLPTFIWMLKIALMTLIILAAIVYAIYLLVKNVLLPKIRRDKNV